MGGFAFKLYGKGEHSGKTVQPCGDAFGGKIDIRVQGVQVPQAFVITAAAGGAEQVHVFFGQVVAFNKSLDDARCGGVQKKLYMDITRSEKQGNPGDRNRLERDDTTDDCSRQLAEANAKIAAAKAALE